MHAQCQWPGDRRLHVHTLQHCSTAALWSGFTAVTLTCGLQFCTFCSPGSAMTSQSHLPQCYNAMIEDRQII